MQLALPNPDLSLPAGLRCQADFGLAAPVSNAKQAGSPAATPKPIQPATLKLEPGPPSGPPGAATPKRIY